MQNARPLVSIVMATYNRAGTIGRAIDSVLKQTYQPVELIIVDDGSSDDTAVILKQYEHPSIRVLVHEVNKGVTAAKNTGLNAIRGEWFTILDSDDEMTPDALEIMMAIPLHKDPQVTAVTCNCWDTTRKVFSGYGPTEDRYLSADEQMTLCKGEFWGITKTALLGNDRFNEKLRGFESTLWYKIDDRANRYYCNKALRIYHTEGDDRIMTTRYNLEKDVKLYENLVEETHFLQKQRKYDPDDYLYLCKTGLVVMSVSGRKEKALRYFNLLEGMNQGRVLRLAARSRTVAGLLLWITQQKKRIKAMIGR